MVKSSFYTKGGVAPEDITTIQDYLDQAKAAKDAAEAIYDDFDDRYLGPKATAPTVDNDGDALAEGAIYYNTTTNNMWVYNGSTWQEIAGDMLVSVYDPDGIAEQLVGVNATQSLANKTLSSVLLSGQADTVGFSPSLSTHLVHKGYVDAADTVMQSDIATNAADIAQLQSDLGGYATIAGATFTGNVAAPKLTIDTDIVIDKSGTDAFIEFSALGDGVVYSSISGNTALVHTNTARVTATSTGADVGGNLSVSDILAVDTDTLYVDSANNRVGVGTSSPSAKLDVVGGDATINGATVGLGSGQISTNLAIGSSALNANTTGNTNIAIGFSSLLSNTTGAFNTAIGGNTLRSNTDGDENEAIGYTALYSNTGGDFNTAVGRGALYGNTTGSSNAAIGRLALSSNTTGNSNAAIGPGSLGSNQTGNNNIAIGNSPLYTNTAGNQNTAIGGYTLYNCTGSKNTAIGYSTGGGITTGSGNTIIGANVSGLSATLTNNVIIADGQGNRRINIDSSGNVGIGTTSPNANAILDLTSTTKAFMPPRMTTTQRDAISSPAAGMVVYNTTTNVLNFYNGTSWGAV